MHALLLTVAVLLAGSGDEQIKLSPGTQTVVKQPGLTRVALGDPAVADVQVGGKGELILTGKKPGRTSLLVWLAGGKRISRTVVVDSGASGDVARLVHDLVNPTLKVEKFGDRVVIDGRLDSLEEYQRLQRLVGDRSDVTVLATLSPDALKIVALQINEALGRNGIRSATAVVVGGRILLEGSVADEEERRKAETIAASYWSAFRGGTN